MIEVDDAIMALLRSDDAGLGGEPQVHRDQMVPPREPGAPPKVVTYPLPYLVYMSSLGADGDESRRLAGRRVRRSVFFQLTYVGGTSEQAKYAGQRARDILEFRLLEVEGFDKLWKIKCEESQRVWRDDDAVRPGGAPLYYGVDQYAVSLMHTRVPTLVSSP